MSRTFWVIIFPVLVLLIPPDAALAVVGHNCISDNKCDSGEICATVVKMPTGTVTQCYNIDSIPGGASIQRTNGQTIQQVCSLIKDSASRFPNSCKPAPTLPPGATNVQCKSDEVGVLNPATGLIAACQKKLPPTATVGTFQQAQSDDQCSPNFSIIDPVGWLNFLNPIRIVTCLTKGLISAIFAAVLALGINLIKFAIDVNSHIGDPDSLARTGFNISLQITNLLFVVGIIIIAFGTMFRRSFGATLIPKFVIIAVLIYFGFWAVTTVVSVSDKITQVFLDAAQANIQWDTLAGALANTKAGFSIVGSFTTTFVEIATVFISLAITFVSALTLIAVAVMYLIRYIYLTLLVILLPFALFLSIFPMLSTGGAGGLWGKWMENFTKWLIFGPVMAFFIYLSFTLLSTYKLSKVSTLATSFAGMADAVAFVLFLLLGLIAANSLGVNGAGYFNKAANTGISWGINKGRSWAQRNALRATTRPLRGAGGKSLTQRMQAWQPINVPLPFGLRIKSGLGVGTVGTAISRYAQRGEDLVKASGKEIEGLSSDRLAQLVPRLSGPTLIAALDKLQKSGDLDKVKTLERLINDKGTEALFKRYTSGSVYGKLEKALGANTAALNAINSADPAIAATLDMEMGKFISGMSTNDLKEIKYNDIYSESGDGKFGLNTEQKEKLQETLAMAMVTENPGGIKSILAGVNSANYHTAHSAVVNAINRVTVTDVAAGRTDVRGRELRRILDEIDNRRRIGDLDTTPPTGTTPAAGPPPTTPGGTTP